MNYPISESHPYNHAEAFCLMHYKSTTTNKDFWVWNSRDGVTPFSVAEDGEEFRHENWKWDKCLPDFQLPNGHRFFRDTTLEEAAHYAVRRLKQFEGTEYAVAPDSDNWYQTLGRLTESFVGQPMMDKYQAPKPKQAAPVDAYSIQLTLRVDGKKSTQVAIGGTQKDVDALIEVMHEVISNPPLALQKLTEK